MKQKTKKRLITYTLVAAWLVGCYFVGQKTHPQTMEPVTEEPITEEPVTEETVTEGTVTEETNSIVPETGSNGVSVSFFNEEEISTDEIPWGFTAGTISLEDGTDAWLLTPGTSLQMTLSEDIALQYKIHPWMKEISDGAALQITYGENNETLMADQEWRNHLFSQDIHSVTIEVPFSDNADGDWVIIQLSNRVTRESGDEASVFSCSVIVS